MFETLNLNYHVLSRDLRVSVDVLRTVVSLLTQGNPPAFIGRYYRDETGGLSEEKIRRIFSYLKEQDKLQGRKEIMLRSLVTLEPRNLELEKKIQEARTERRLDDLFFPFKRKKDEPLSASQALYSFVQDILTGTYSGAITVEQVTPFVENEPHCKSPADILDKIQRMIADDFSQNVELRHRVREVLRQFGKITSHLAIPLESNKPPVRSTNKLVEPSVLSEEQQISQEFAAVQKTLVAVVPPSVKRDKRLAEKEKSRQEKVRQYGNYFDYKIDLRNCPGQTILNLVRGERTGAIRVEVELANERLFEAVKGNFIAEDHPHREFLEGCLEEALANQIAPVFKKETWKEQIRLTQEELARTLAKNLHNLLFRSPLVGRRVLAIAPGPNRSCKLAALDQFGNFLATETAYMMGGSDRRAKNIRKISRLIQTYGISVIVIGNGTGCREAEEFVARLIREHFPNNEVAYLVMSDAGIMQYTSSEQGKNDLPQHNPLVRSAITLGRRLLDPIGELAKVDPIDLVIGLAPQDSKPKNLKETLSEVLEMAVSTAGVNVNLAEETTLRYVCGLNPLLTTRICEYRKANGPFRRREELLKVPGMTNGIWRKSIGFLRIIGGYEPLDATWIHPEWYPLACQILQKVGFTSDDLRSSPKRDILNAELAKLDPVALAEELSPGHTYQMRTILAELICPGQDGTQALQHLLFKKGTLKIEDLTPGMELTGTVANIVDFGAFVDIGLNQSGLVHISHIGDGFVKNALDKVSIGQVVKVWVLEADLQRHRISLTMIQPGTERRGVSQQQPQNRTDEGKRSEHPDPVREENRPARPPRFEHQDRGERQDRPPQQGRTDSTNQRGNDSRPYTPREPHADRRPADRSPREGSAERTPRAARSDQPARGSNNSQDRSSQNSGRFRSDRGESNTPRNAVVAAPPKKIVPLSEGMKKGKEPMRSFSDLAQLFGVVEADKPDQQKGKK